MRTNKQQEQYKVVEMNTSRLLSGSKMYLFEMDCNTFLSSNYCI